MPIASDVYTYECRNEKQLVYVPVARNGTSEDASLNILVFDAMSHGTFLFPFVSLLIHRNEMTRTVEVLKNKEEHYSIFAFTGFNSPSNASFSSLFRPHGRFLFASEASLHTTVASDSCSDLLEGNEDIDNDGVLFQCLKELFGARNQRQRIRDMFQFVHSIQQTVVQKKSRFLSLDVVHTQLPFSDMDGPIAEGLEQFLMPDSSTIQLLMGVRGNRGRTVDVVPVLSEETTNPVFILVRLLSRSDV